MQCTADDMSASCWAIANYISTTFSIKYPTLTYMTRGSIWHYLLSGYSISCAFEEADKEQIINIWKHEFIDFLNKLPSHIKHVAYRERFPDDISIKSTIKDSLEGF